MLRRVFLQAGLTALCGVLLRGNAAQAVSPASPRIRLRPGDAAYVCPNPACDRGSIARLPAKCACGEAMVEAEVLAVDDSAILVRIGSKTLSVPAQAQYVCACGARCPCSYVSQEPGWCACGHPLTRVEG